MCNDNRRADGREDGRTYRQVDKQTDRQIGLQQVYKDLVKSVHSDKNVLNLSGSLYCVVSSTVPVLPVSQSGIQSVNQSRHQF